MERIQDTISKMNFLNSTDEVLHLKIGSLTEATKDCVYFKCDGSGLIHYRNEDRSEVMLMCKCFERRRQLSKIKSARIPDEFVNKRLDDFHEELYEHERDQRIGRYAKKAASRYVENFTEIQKLGKGLYFYSETKGSGKTLLGIAIFNELLVKYDINGMYISVVNMLDEMKNLFGNSNSDFNSYQLLKTFKEVEVLVLDDLGVEQTTAWSEEVLTQLLDERMANKRPTIITSNIPSQYLGAKYPEGRIQSRINKMIFPVGMPEEDVREKLSKKENEKIARILFS